MEGLRVDLVIKKPRSISDVRRINGMAVYPVAAAPKLDVDCSRVVEEGVDARMERAKDHYVERVERARDAWVPALRQLVITSELASGSVVAR